MLDTGIVAGTALSALVAAFSLLLVVTVRRLAVEVAERECVLITRGRDVIAVFDTPGLHWLTLRQALGSARHRMSLRHQTCVGAGHWARDTGAPRIIQVWLDYQVVRPRESFERMADLPAELKTTVIGEVRRRLTEDPALEAGPRRDELVAAVLAAAQPRAEWLGARLTSVAVNLGHSPRPSPPAPVFDLTGLPPLPRVSDWRS